MPRSETFYIEFITLTVLSLVTANLWVRLAVNALNAYSNSVHIDLIAAIIATVVAIILMNMLFSKTKNQGLSYEKFHREEMFEDS